MFRGVLCATCGDLHWTLPSLPIVFASCLMGIFSYSTLVFWGIEDASLERHAEGLH